MEAIVGGKIGLREAGLEVVRTLKRFLTISSDISVMSDEISHYYLTLTSQMTFNVRNFPVSFIWFDDFLFKHFPLTYLHNLSPLSRH